MEEWQERLFDEHNELRKKIYKLSDFVSASSFITLQPEDQELLKDQLIAMRTYSEILQKRINKFTGA